MSSLLCSTDTIAAVSLLNPQKQPKLFSVIFGEGITNDAVCIILFNTVLQFHKQSIEPDAGGITLMTGLGIVWSFLQLLFLSMFVGCIFGMLASYILKRNRGLTHNCVGECTLLFIFAYLAYVTSELLSLSGIISLLVCSIVLKEFAWLNMSM